MSKSTKLSVTDGPSLETPFLRGLEILYERVRISLIEDNLTANNLRKFITANISITFLCFKFIAKLSCRYYVRIQHVA